jgi:regulation of enolase protein 1 (concanavalin A-like superfamily)
MPWLNEPAVWSGDASDLTVAVEPDTDFWRTTHYGFVRDSGHFADYDIRAIREGDAVQILCGDQPVRLAPFPEGGELMSGPMCAAPKGPGFTARFLNGDSPS